MSGNVTTGRVLEHPNKVAFGSGIDNSQEFKVYDPLDKSLSRLQDSLDQYVAGSEKLTMEQRRLAEYLVNSLANNRADVIEATEKCRIIEAEAREVIANYDVAKNKELQARHLMLDAEEKLTDLQARYDALFELINNQILQAKDNSLESGDLSFSELNLVATTIQEITQSQNGNPSPMELLTKSIKAAKEDYANKKAAHELRLRYLDDLSVDLINAQNLIENVNKILESARKSNDITYRKTVRGGKHARQETRYDRFRRLLPGNRNVKKFGKDVLQLTGGINED